MPRRTTRDDAREARLLSALASAPHGLMRRDILRDVFKGALRAAELDELLARLAARGLAVERTELRTYTVRRPVRVVRLK